MQRPAAAVCLIAGLPILGSAADARAQAQIQPRKPAPCAMALTQAQAQAARDNLDSGLYDPPLAARGSTTALPIVAHIVRRSDGTGGLSLADLEQSIFDAQTQFAAGGYELCLADVITIDSDAFYSAIDTEAEIDALRSTNPVPGAINIYFTDQLSTGGSPLCGLSSFTFSPVQGIVIRNGCTAQAGNASTLAHEIGHYFDLFHTHENALGTECVDGSNCDTNGDQICDTPADPNLLGEVDGACDWIGSDADPCGSGMPFSPPVRNLMSYSTSTCRQQFTAEQFGRIAATLANLRTDLDPVLCEPTCDNIADVNQDAQLTPADFNAWVLAFNAADPAADQNADGIVDPSDFNAWVLNYNAGCP